MLFPSKFLWCFERLVLFEVEGGGGGGRWCMIKIIFWKGWFGGGGVGVWLKSFFEKGGFGIGSENFDEFFLLKSMWFFFFIKLFQKV